MTERADAARVRRWQESVAADPGSPDFMPLAEVYRREGRGSVARRLCIRGLQRHPDHVEAHFLLGRLHREAGELTEAFDEWDIALRLDPGHRAARRAIGYLCLERRDWASAARHLELAAAAHPGDQRLAGALAMARRRAASAEAPEMDAADGLAGPLERFVRESRVRLAVVMDATGRVLTRHGTAAGLDLAGFASLGAGIQSASGELARLLGQPKFEQLYQGASDHQLFLAPLDTGAGELLLAAVFGSEATIGMVRVLFAALAREVVDLPLTLGHAPARPDADSFEALLQAGVGAAASRS